MPSRFACWRVLLTNAKQICLRTSSPDGWLSTATRPKKNLQAKENDYRMREEQGCAIISEGKTWNVENQLGEKFKKKNASCLYQSQLFVLCFKRILHVLFSCFFGFSGHFLQRCAAQVFSVSRDSCTGRWTMCSVLSSLIPARAKQQYAP